MRGTIGGRSALFLASRAFRARRMRLFRRLLETLPQPLRILDVGGEEAFWTEARFETGRGIDVVLLDLALQNASAPGVSSIVGDARSLPFRDGSFEVVFSNSVIEHLGSIEEQRRMAAEIRRVARRYFVQTPNRRFPLEPHSLVPFFQWFPVRLRSWMVRRLPIGWHGRIRDERQARALVESIRLLDAEELRTLFPGARLVAERVFGMVKSYMVCGGW
jgi:ubiquinone/menaquinone biosynthesis C-methylase UbiE